MTTIAVDLINGVVYSDSRMCFRDAQGQEKISTESAIKLTKHGNRIYFEAGSLSKIKIAQAQIEEGEDVRLDGSCTVGYMYKAFNSNIMVVYEAVDNPWYKRIFKGKKSTVVAHNTKFSIINGIAVFGSGYHHARYAIDNLGLSPADAIRYAATKDSGTNNIVQKIAL